MNAPHTTKKHLTSLHQLLLLLFLIGLTSYTQAETITWTGDEGSTADWHEMDNWDLNRVPIASDDVVIPQLSGIGVSYPELNGTTTVKSIVMETSSVQFTVNRTGVLNLSGSNSHAIYVRGTFTSYGKIYINNANGAGILVSDSGNGDVRLYGETYIGNSSNVDSYGITNFGTVSLLYSSSVANPLIPILKINNTTQSGIFNGGTGTFSIDATANTIVEIGNMGNIGAEGIINFGTFDLLTGTINIKDVGGGKNALFNKETGVFTCNATLNIGGATLFPANGIFNEGTFTCSGTINIDNIDNDAIYTTKNFTNHGTIAIGFQNAILHHAIFNIGANAQIDNYGAIEIENSVFGGIVQDEESTFNNHASGTININQAAIGTNTYGMFLTAYSTFYNSGGGLNIDHSAAGIHVQENGLLVNQNEGIITLGALGTFGDLSIDVESNGQIINEACSGIIQENDNRMVAHTLTNRGWIRDYTSTNEQLIGQNDGYVYNFNGGSFTVSGGNPPITETVQYWTGCADTDWGNAANWTLDNDPNNEVIIPPTTNAPSLGNNLSPTVKTLTIEANASLTIENTGTLNINDDISGLNNNGTLTNNGQINTKNFTNNNGSTVQGDGHYTFSQNWTNDGTFNRGNSTVTALGTTLSSIGGTTSMIFNNLELNTSGDGETQLAQNIQVRNEVQMTAGNLNLNGHFLNLSGNGKIVNESSDSYIYGNAAGSYIFKGTYLLRPNEVNPGNIGTTITSSEDMGITTIQRFHEVQTINGETSINRYYTITPTNNTGLDATLSLHYLDHELGSIFEEDLTPFYDNGTTWEETLTTETNEVDNFVKVEGLDSFSDWTLAGGDRTFIWTGAVDTDWGITGNWNRLDIPNPEYTVVIPEVNSNNYPFVTGGNDILVRRLIIESGAELTLDENNNCIIEQVSETAIENYGTVENYGIIAINEVNGTYLINQGNFRNYNAINIGLTTQNSINRIAIKNQGNFENISGIITIKALRIAISNQGTMTNNAGAVFNMLDVYNAINSFPEEGGNLSPSVDNSGEININYTIFSALNIETDFTNHESGIINIGQTLSTIYSGGGLTCLNCNFSNSGEINMAKIEYNAVLIEGTSLVNNTGNWIIEQVSQTAIENYGTVENHGNILLNEVGLYYITNQGTFKNYNTINIGLNNQPPIGEIALNNLGIFENISGAIHILFVTVGLYNEGTVLNSENATINISHVIAGIETSSNLGLNLSPMVENSGLIRINHFDVQGIGLYSDFINNTSGVLNIITGTSDFSVGIFCPSCNFSNSGEVNIAVMENYGVRIAGGQINNTSIGHWNIDEIGTNAIEIGTGSFSNSGHLNIGLNNLMYNIDGLDGIGLNGVYVENAGSFTNQATGTMSFNNCAGVHINSENDFSNLGTYKGIGDSNIGIGTLGGTVAPGLSTGHLRFVGDQVFATDNVLEIEVNGTTPDTEHDVVTVTGSASLNGTLTVAVNYAPTHGDRIVFLLYGLDIDGPFSNAILPLGWSLDYNVLGEVALVYTAPLAVELLDFSAERQNDAVLLQWQTASEKEHDYFIIEHSMDGLNFEGIEKVFSQGNDNSLKTYEVWDEEPQTGMNYYRLKQTDLNGEFSYSEVRTVFFEKENLTIAVYPNPTTSILNIEFQSSFENGTLQLLNSWGQVVLATTLQPQSTLELSHLPKGVYILKIKNGDREDVEQVVLQ